MERVVGVTLTAATALVVVEELPPQPAIHDKAQTPRAMVTMVFVRLPGMDSFFCFFRSF
jgi:hypothetical protein